MIVIPMMNLIIHDDSDNNDDSAGG